MDLVRFRIPAGWWVMKNGFFDVDPPPSEGGCIPGVAFVTDILALQYTVPWKEPTEDGYIVYLDWYPDHDPQGQYRLVLLHKGDDKDDVICTYENRDRWKVRDRLETWLDLVIRAADRAELERLLRKFKRDAETS